LLASTRSKPSRYPFFFFAKRGVYGQLRNISTPEEQLLPNRIATLFCSFPTLMKDSRHPLQLLAFLESVSDDWSLSHERSVKASRPELKQHGQAIRLLDPPISPSRRKPDALLACCSLDFLCIPALKQHTPSCKDRSPCCS